MLPKLYKRGVRRDHAPKKKPPYKRCLICNKYEGVVKMESLYSDSIVLLCMKCSRFKD